MYIHVCTYTCVYVYVHVRVLYMYVYIVCMFIYKYVHKVPYMCQWRHVPRLSPRPRSAVHGLPGRTACMCVCVCVCVCVAAHGNQTDCCHVFCWLGATYLVLVICSEYVCPVPVCTCRTAHAQTSMPPRKKQRSHAWSRRFDSRSRNHTRHWRACAQGEKACDPDRAHRNHGQHRRLQRAGYPLASDDLLRQVAPICARRTPLQRSQATRPRLAMLVVAASPPETVANRPPERHADYGTRPGPPHRRAGYLAVSGRRRASNGHGLRALLAARRLPPSLAGATFRPRQGQSPPSNERSGPQNTVETLANTPLCMSLFMDARQCSCITRIVKSYTMPSTTVHPSPSPPSAT